jgi:hypothetical protein
VKRKYYKVAVVILILISIVMYALDIIYSNKVHEIIILMDESYNSQFKHYGNIAKRVSSLYITSIQALPIPILLLNKKHKFKGFLYLCIIEILIFAICFGLDIILDNFYFKPSAAIAQFISILIGTTMVYLFMCLILRFRNKKEQLISIGE